MWELTNVRSLSMEVTKHVVLRNGSAFHMARIGPSASTAVKLACRLNTVLNETNAFPWIKTCG